MQAYAEGWELLQAVDQVDNVTEVFDSWREGTVIRSWLLDLLVAALDEDAHLEQASGATPTTPARAGGRSRRRSTTRSPCTAITASLFARFASRQDDSPAMKAIAAMRNQFGGHAVRGARRPPPTPTRRGDQIARGREPLYVAHLTLHDFRSYAGPRARAGAGGRPRSWAATARARPTSSRRSTTCHGSARTGSPATLPLVRAGTDQAVVRAAVIRDERRAVLEIEINPGRSNRARINKSPLPRARELLGLVRTVVFAPDDLALVKGDPTERRQFADDLLVQLQPLARLALTIPYRRRSSTACDSRLRRTSGGGTETGADVRELTRLRVVDREMTGRAINRRELRGQRASRSGLAVIRVVEGPDRRRDPYAPLFVEHRVVDVVLALPDRRFPSTARGAACSVRWPACSDPGPSARRRLPRASRDRAPADSLRSTRAHRRADLSR